MTTTNLASPVRVEPAQREFLEQVAALAPIFVALPGGTEFIRPAGWPQTPVRSLDEVLAGWRPGYALCAALGAALAVVDVDPRNGGDVGGVRSLLAAHGVQVFAEVTTPGNGVHFYVAADPHLRSVNSPPGWPGVDILGTGKHVFLPGTQRPNYQRRGYTVVSDNLAALVDGGDPDGAAALAGWVAGLTSRSGRERATTRTVNLLSRTDASGYVQRALSNEVGTLAGTPEGRRNDQLNDSAFNLSQLVAGGYLDRHQVWDALRDTALAIGLTPSETEATLASAFEAGEAQPRQVPDLAPPLTLLPFDAADPDDTDFWDARPMLTHLHTFARSRRAAPWAVLGVVLARVVVATPPLVVLPPLVGTDASLNLFVAVVGPSGAGKGAAVGAAKEALRVGHLTSFPVGSGEGLTHLFVKRTKEGIDQHTQAVLAEVAEVDTLTALGARQGATLQPVLRQAYMGEEFGFGYADPTKRLVVGAHKYRLAMVVGVQPKRAEGLLDDADGGTPQRFLWLPAVDPSTPDVAPATPKPKTWALPAMPRGDVHDGRIRIPVCTSALAAVDAASLARVRGQQAALDGHALLTRLKVAAALGLLDRRVEVSEEDWELAGTVMAVSDATRGHTEAVVQATRRSINNARGAAEGDRAAIVHEAVETKKAERLARNIERKLIAAADGMSGAELRRAIHHRDRENLDDALALLLGSGRIVEEQVAPDETGGGGHGHRYRASRGRSA